MEKSQGGDGNGIAFLQDGTIRVAKGVQAKTDALALFASEIESPILFHTRRASSGPIVDSLCQPFMQGGIAITHNGHWGSWDEVARELIMAGHIDAHYPINDSLTAATAVAQYGRYFLETIHTGVFVIMTLNGTYLHLRGGSFEYLEDVGYASEFPTSWLSKTMKNDTIATLEPDGPEFEMGGWQLHRGVPLFGASVVHTIPSAKENNTEDLCILCEKEPRVYGSRMCQDCCALCAEDLCVLCGMDEPVDGGLCQGCLDKWAKYLGDDCPHEPRTTLCTGCGEKPAAGTVRIDGYREDLCEECLADVNMAYYAQKYGAS